MRAVGGCDCLLKAGVIPRVDNTGPFDPRSKGFGHDLPQLRHEWPLDILLLATREHNRYVQNVCGLRQRQRMTLHHLQGKGLDPLHGADLMVDQEQRRVFSCEEVSHIFSSYYAGRLPSASAAVSLFQSTSASKPSGSRKNTLSLEPKSVMVPSDAPNCIRRTRTCSKVSRLWAFRPKWSMRPRPNIGVWTRAWVLPGTSNTLNSLWPPMDMITMRSPA